MNILLIDDHELFRAGARLLLADLDADLRVQEANSCASALELVEAAGFVPQLVLLDYHLPGLSGLDAVREIRERFGEAALVVLSAENSPSLIRAVIDAGASGFVPKTASHAVMLAALRLVLAGGTYLPPLALQDLRETPEPNRASVDLALMTMTPRQREMLDLAVRGLANKLIARQMSISEATVKAHLSSIFRLLGVRNRTEAMFALTRSRDAGQRAALPQDAPPASGEARSEEEE